MNQTYDREMPYLYLLHKTEGIGDKTIGDLLRAFGDAKTVYHAPEKSLAHFLTRAQLDSFLKERKSSDPEKTFAALEKMKIRFITRAHPDYPKRLQTIPDPPYALYVRGRLPDEEVPSVAVIGARMCSEYGRYMARTFGTELAQAGIQVISGMALGVDSIAQKGALQAGGASFAVLGCGADVCYPPENRDLYDNLLTSGGILSEYVPGTQPKRTLFPRRNRIISGLADAVLVIEARKKSGTLITVDMALEQGVDVYALPGRATDRLSDGCNELLKQGAVPATSAADIIERFYGVYDREKGFVPAAKEEKPAPAFSLNKEDRALIESLDINIRPVSEIERSLRENGYDMPPSEIMCRLVELSLRGLIEQEGSFFARKGA